MMNSNVKGFGSDSEQKNNRMRLPSREKVMSDVRGKYATIE